MTRRPTALTLGPLVAFALACSAGDGGAERARPRFPVEVASVERRAIEERRLLSGTLESTEEVRVVARVAGRVDELAVGLGDRVGNGQVIARLSDPDLDADLGASGAGASAALARVASAEAREVTARRELEVAMDLDARGALPANALKDARDALTAAEAALRAARADAGAAAAELARSRARSDLADVVALWPSDDPERAVAAVHVARGAVVGPLDPLVTLVDLDPLRAVVFVTERDHARLQPGMAAELTTDARAEERFVGRVDRIAPVFDEGSRQARVEVDVPNAEGRLAPGAFVRVSVTLAREESAAVVPIDAVIRRDGRDVVYVVDGEVAREVPVAIGLREPGFVQVLGEVQGPVVTVGQAALSDGAPVKVVAP